MTNDQVITEAVKSKYGAIAREQGSCCGTAVTDVSTGYTTDELAQLPQGANLGLGCGNPTRLADLKAGETVIDLGSGAGIDCFLASKLVGPTGKVIGVDMTEAMITNAKQNALAGGFDNVEFRLGQIEAMPIEDGAADVVISNCVINLAPDKERVFREIYRVLKPGGRFTVSDIVANGEIPENERRDMDKWAGCVAGAMPRDKYLATVQSAGFVDLEIKDQVEYDYKKSATYSLASMTLQGKKPNHRP